MDTFENQMLAPVKASEVHSDDMNQESVTMNTDCGLSVMGCDRTGPFPNQLLMLVYFCLMSAVGALANLVLLLAIAVLGLLKRPASVYVGSMVAADLFLCGGYAPYCVLTLTEPGRWAGCEAVAMLAFLALMASFLSLTCVAVNRYLLVTLPQGRYEALYSPGRVGVSLVGVWGLAALCTLPLLLGEGEVGVDRRLGICTVSLSTNHSYVADLLVSLGVGLPSLVLITAAYLGVWRRFRQSTRAVRRNTTITTSTTTSGGTSRESWRLSANLFIITMVTTVCWAPSVFLIFIDMESQAEVVLYQLIVLLGLSASVLNPILNLALNSNTLKVYQTAARRISQAPRTMVTLTTRQ